MTDFRARGTIMGPAGLTAVFGMGTGVTPPVSSPEKRPGGGQAPRTRWSGCRSRSRKARVSSESWWWRHPRTWTLVADRGRRMRMREGFRRPRSGRAAWVGGGRSGWSSRSAVGTGPLRRSPAVHSQPIDLVVFQEPSHVIACRKPRLGGGFALRCLQRLSCPDLATRRCPERDSRHTRGRSSPILSY